ncbi:unnamed protein product, partial [Amoebophrya sp. A25]
ATAPSSLAQAPLSSKKFSAATNTKNIKPPPKMDKKLRKRFAFRNFKAEKDSKHGVYTTWELPDFHVPGTYKVSIKAFSCAGWGESLDTEITFGDRATMAAPKRSGLMPILEYVGNLGSSAKTKSADKAAEAVKERKADEDLVTTTSGSSSKAKNKAALQSSSSQEDM